MNRNKRILLTSIFLFGLAVPFIPSLTVIEMFFLLIPFAVIFAVTLIYLILSLLNKQMNSRNAMFAFSIVPTFVIAQLLASFSVDKVQRYRSNHIITELEHIKSATGELPNQYGLTAGI
ncbi:MAG: hypothetical protein IPO87_06765 [Flavobacteriales bacterium]|nr:hypothetical protein [Flavobacteriales bacterium]